MIEGKVRAARKLLNDGTQPREITTSLGVSVPMLYRRLSVFERA